MLLSGEAERLKNCKGRVYALPYEPGVYRLWMPDEGSPGLAMTRAFGDFCLKDYGLISIPEVSYRKITNKDEFVVLASDGVREMKDTVIYENHDDCDTTFQWHIYIKTEVKEPEIIKQRHWFAGMGCVIKHRGHKDSCFS